MRSFSTFLLVALILSAYACVAGQNIPKAIEEKIPAPATDADFYSNQLPSDDMAILGQALFFDKILSGNKPNNN